MKYELIHPFIHETNKKSNGNFEQLFLKLVNLLFIILNMFYIMDHTDVMVTRPYIPLTRQ